MPSSLLLVGHGSHLDPHSSLPVYAHANELRKRGHFDQVTVGFWKEEPNLSRCLDGVDGDDVTVVPIFISSGYFTKEVVPRELGLLGPITKKNARIVRYTEPIGTHPLLADVIACRAEELGAKPSSTLAILGHGTTANPNSEKNVYAQAEIVRSLGRFREVVTVFLDQEPRFQDILMLTTSQEIAVVPLFVADGWHVGQTIPANLETAIECGSTDRLQLGAAVGTHPKIAEVVEALAQEAATWQL